MLENYYDARAHELYVWRYFIHKGPWKKCMMFYRIWFIHRW